MPQPSEQSMNTAKSLGDFGKSANIGGGADGGSVIDLLGQIYDMMLKVQEEQDIDHELSMADEKKKEKREGDRNAALIKALTARRKPKAKKPPKKKEEPKKPEEKPPTKPAEKKAPEKKPPEKKEETVKKQVDKESEKAKQQAQKEADKAKKTAEKEQAAAKKKVEQEAKQKAEPVKPPEVKPKAEVAPKAPEVKPPPSAAKTKGTALIPSAVVGTAATLASTLASAGITEKGQANIMAQVKAESGFVSQSEKLERYTGKNLFSMYGGPEVSKNKSGIPINAAGNQIRFKTIEEANTVVKEGPVAIGDIIYGGRMGNDKPGDGYKYRGRGFIQITGKDAYRSLSKYLNIDLISNPDLLNDQQIAMKSLPWFFLEYKKKYTNGDPKSLENISIVNKSVGFADKMNTSGELESEHRKKLALEFEKEKVSFSSVPSSTPTSGKVAGLSKENIELNANLEKQQQSITVNNVASSGSQENITPIKQAKVDDRSPMQKKMQG